MNEKIRDTIMLAVTPIIQDYKRDQECAHAVIGGLIAAGYMIVPIKPTDHMLEELARIGDGPGISGEDCWGYMLAAAAAECDPL